MKRTKRFLAMLLTLILCVGEISSTGLKVFAAGEEEDTSKVIEDEKDNPAEEDVPVEPEDPVGEENYWLIVGGVQVKESNKDNIPAFPDGKGSASFDPETHTLTLNNVTGFKGTYDTKEAETGKTYIYSLYGSLTIKGNMDVKAAWPEVDSVIAVNGGVDLNGKFKIEGDNCSGIALTEGSGITITDGTNLDIVGNTYTGISGKGNVKVSGGTVRITTEDEKPVYGIEAKSFKMTGGTVDIKGQYSGIGIKNGDIDISGGELSIDTRTSGIHMETYASNTFNVTGGELTAKAFNGEWSSYGIWFEGAGTGGIGYNGRIDLNFNGGKVTATGEDYGIYGNYKYNESAGNQHLAIDGAEVTAEATGKEGRGVQVFGKLKINSGRFSAKGKDAAVWYDFEGEPDLSEDAPVELVKPAGGRAGDYNILDANGNAATEVLIVEKTRTDYSLWVGGQQVNSLNKKDILKDGKASYDPSTNTLTFNNATLTTFGSHVVDRCLAAVESKGIPLTIKGNLTVDGNNQSLLPKQSLTAILFVESGTEASLDGTFTLKNLTRGYGVFGYSSNIKIKGGNIDIEAGSGAVGAEGTITLADGIGILSPEGAVFRTINGYTRLYESADLGTEIKKAVIGPVNAAAETFTVTFDLNGKTGPMPAPQKVEKGKTATKPADPKVEGFTFKAWCTDKEGKKEYDFSTAVNADITLYAKWEKTDEPAPLPNPIEGGISPLDPVPELIAGVTTDLYLVKGQKFNIGQGWYVDKNDKDSKKKVSISKKGAFKAKAEGEAVIKCGSGATAWEVKLHISKPRMKSKSLKIQLETATDVKQEQIAFDYDKTNLNVLWYSSNPDVVTVDDNGKVTTAGKGSSKVTAYINGSAYTCTVSVKEKEGLQKHTLHVAKDASKTISIKGLKKPEWKMSEEGIVEVKKNKVSGIKAGTVDLSFTQGDITYTVTVIVEDLTMSGTGLKPGKTNKYTIDELKIGDTTKLSFAGVEQDAVFKSSKPDIAFIDEELNVVIRGKGKAKFTAKVNGKPITISVNVK